MRVTQSQNVPLSCLSRPLADRLAEAAYRDILGLSYARAFSAAWSTARLWFYSGPICIKKCSQIDSAYTIIIFKKYENWKDYWKLCGCLLLLQQ